MSVHKEMLESLDFAYYEALKHVDDDFWYYHTFYQRNIKTLIEKDEQTKVVKPTNSDIECPRCGETLLTGHDLPYYFIKYCFNCGKHLSWEEEYKND